MKRRTLLASALTVAALPRLAIAQSPQRVARIGWITAQQASSLEPYVEAFRYGLEDFGYVEGRNLVLVLRYGDDHLERVPELAGELVRIPVDLIVAQGAANFLVNKLDLPVPVVYAFSGDPVIAGFADSLARPHVNMTGLTFMAPELTAKRLELLREMIPELDRVAILAYPSILASTSSAPIPRKPRDGSVSVSRISRRARWTISTLRSRRWRRTRRRRFHCSPMVSRCRTGSASSSSR